MFPFCGPGRSRKQYLGNVEGALWVLGGCLGHAAERQSCLQRDVINYSEAALKGTLASRNPLCSRRVQFRRRLSN